MYNLRITAKGLNEAILFMKRLQREHIGDYTDFINDDVVPRTEALVERCFQTNGFGRWRELAESTKKEKARKGYPLTTMVRTGRYKREARRLYKKEVTRNSLLVTLQVPYAIYHELGKGRRRRQVLTLVANKLREELRDMWISYNQRKLP